MKEKLKIYVPFLLGPLFFIIGLIRKNQIESYQIKHHIPTMTGILTLFSYTFIAIFIVVVLAILNLKLKKITKVVVLTISTILILFILFIYH